MRSEHPLIEEEIWIDYLEGELPEPEWRDLKLVLKNSLMDQVVCQSVSVTKDIIQGTDDSSLPEDGRYYQNLHARIMQKIATPDGEPRKRQSRRRKSLEFLGLFL